MATQEVGYVLAQPEKDGIAVSATAMGAGKQGHAFCGGCCDVRRAVIIVNIVSIAFASLGLVTVGGLMAVSSSASYDDDEVQEAMSSFNEGNLAMGVFFALAAIRIVANALGIYGAVTYNIWMVGISLAAYCIDFAMGVVSVNIVGLVTNALFAYPHFFFIKEVRSGLMSEANYVNEKQSCCCV
jgi:hypothetical protein